MCVLPFQCWRWKEKKATFWCIMLYYFKKGKNTTVTNTLCMENLLWLIKHVKSGLPSLMPEISHWVMLHSWVEQLQLLLFSHSAMSNSLRPQELQHARLPSNSCPLRQWYYSTISSSLIPFSCLLSSQPQGLFQWPGSLHQVGKILEFQLWHQSFQWIFRVEFL